MEAKQVAFSTRDFSGKAESSWLFNKMLGEEIIMDAPQNFSVFTLGNDIWGYSANYGIRYSAKLRGKYVNFSAKSPITYLVVANNAQNNPLFDVRWWKEAQIKINKQPIKTWQYHGLYVIEKYDLTADEVAIPEDPLLMSSNMSLR